MNQKKRFTSGMVALLLSCVLSSANSNAEVNFFIDGAFAFGGDEIAEFEIIYDDDYYYDTDFDAGTGTAISAGISFDLGSNFRTDLSLGYKIGGVFTEDDSVTFDRVLGSAIVFYAIGPVNLGAGLTHEFNGDIDLTDAGGPKAAVKDATGQIIAANYMFDFGLYVGAKYTFIDYELEDYIDEYNGDNFAVVVGYLF